MEKIGTIPNQRDQTDIIRIGVLPIDGFALMSYASTVEPFRAANMLSRRMLYEVVNISPSLAPVSSSGAASVAPQATLLNAPRLDYVFVVAGGNPATFADMAVWNWLAKIARFGVRLGGVEDNARSETLTQTTPSTEPSRYPQRKPSTKAYVNETQAVGLPPGGGEMPVPLATEQGAERKAARFTLGLCGNLEVLAAGRDPQTRAPRKLRAGPAAPRTLFDTM